MKHPYILTTAKASLAIQLLVGIVGLYALTIELDSSHALLHDILALETMVQFIELVYYGWLVYSFSQITYDITSTRYFDWMLSTPIMIVSTTAFFLYNNDVISEEVTSTTITPNLLTLLTPHLNSLGWILLMNWLMLLFGYFGEKKWISRTTGFVTGSFAFCLSFVWLYQSFVGVNYTNICLFWFMFGVWSCYGLAYLFSYEIKNIAYNVLDVLSKNFYGLFLAWTIIQLAPNKF